MIINSTKINEMSSLQTQQSNSATPAAATAKATNVNSGASTAQTANSPAYSVHISKNGIARNAASASSSNAISQAALTQYTDTQLKQMLNAGKITRLQYDMVMSGRKSTSEQAAPAAASGAATAATASAK